MHNFLKGGTITGEYWHTAVSRLTLFLYGANKGDELIFHKLFGDVIQRTDYWFKFEVNSANGNPFYDSASVGYLIQLNGGQYAWNPSANGSFNTYGNWCTVRLELSEVATNGINAGWNNLFWIMQPNSDWNTDHSFANIRIEKKQ